MTERLERLCDVCGNLGFSDGGDGFFYCTRCNSQASDFVDTGVDDADLNAFDGGIYSTTQTRVRPRQEAIVAEQISQFKASQSQYQEILKTMDDYNDGTVNNGVGPTEPSDFGSVQETITSPDYYYSEIRKRYIMGVQIMVQLQCKALVEKFNVSPLIVGLTGPIWLRYLAYERVMVDEWADEVIHESQSQTQGEVGEFKPVAKHKAEPRNLLGKRAIPIWHRSLRNEEEADFDALRLLQILETKYSEHKDVYDYAQDLALYLQYCKDVIFAGINSSCEDREEESMIEELWDFYQKNKDMEACKEECRLLQISG